MRAAANQSSRSTPGITAAVVQGLVRWVAKIADAAKFLPRRRPVSAENVPARGQPGAGPIATSDPDTKPTTAQSCATTFEVSVGPALVSLAQTPLDAQEIERRRDLVRTLFNDFWHGAHAKPGSFAARLDEAEDYLNMRLAANGESWCLDANTRASLGLPPRSGSPH
jgi:hypothetical protein